MKNIYLLFLFISSTFSSYAQLLYIDAETATFIDATTYNAKNNALLIFSGGSLMLYDINSDEIIEPRWFRLEGFSKIEAAIKWSENQVLIFESDQFRIMDVNTAEFLTKKEKWLGFPEEWNNNFDAAVRWDENNILFSKDDTFLIYNFIESEYTVYDYFSTWEGWPESWNTKLEAIFSFGDSIYFLNDGEVIEYSKIDSTFGAPIEIGFRS
ncbi:hypothetical protein LBV24_14555 [Winogradskyella sp. 2Y89]|uniref:Uncharacterized protein n=1 Tax=Winogradskyella vincentii TaxID=2877122 RepID=A0ABS7Y3D6_9FLAO|nr:hypothetical protein [Winogradskyella vincentii]